VGDDRGERGGTADVVWRAGRGRQPPSRPPALFQVGLGALTLLIGRTGPTVDGSKFGPGVVALISMTLTAFNRGFRGSTLNSWGASVSKVLVRRSIVAKQKFSLHAFDDGS
jgi:hypothetical protein